MRSYRYTCAMGPMGIVVGRMLIVVNKIPSTKIIYKTIVVIINAR